MPTTNCDDDSDMPTKMPADLGILIDVHPAITGPQLQFFDLVASWPGSAHDSRIFDNSWARVQYERGTGILLGDKGYPCRSYLMTPFRDRGTKDSPQHR
ncbi:hypothetical protein HPB50_001421 [Hyalomma asiaticum]|uniref:Uncharacterized protein n=1 Tax=Hyalomma asiaticum TaxID=266040 RepID=A0ACB7TAS4_HYAAI|nr:hypothetical protein HPB50_001421 [Hyalomma asiaticum]